MVGTDFRSGSLESVTPKNDATFSDDVSKFVFSWKGYAGEDVTLTIIDNKGESVYTSKTGRGPIVVEKKFAEGLYYWKIQNSSDLMHVGKFRVE